MFNDDGTVTGRFVNGNQCVGLMIVGADGPRSKVRELILGAEKGAATSMDLILFNNTICYNDAEKARFVRKNHPVCCTAMHPEMYVFLGGMSSSIFADFQHY
jgi:hypothetical protein